jgi:hypothetical protein
MNSGGKYMINSKLRVLKVPTADEALQRDVDKLRAAVLLLAAPRNSKLKIAKGCVAEFRAKGLRISLRSLYRWRNRYLAFGFEGLRRKSRSDRGSFRFGHDVQEAVIAAAAQARYPGDIMAIYRRFAPSITYETFRSWVRRLQQVRRSA